MPKLSSSYAVRPKLPTIARPVPGLGSCRLYTVIYMSKRVHVCVCVHRGCIVYVIMCICIIMYIYIYIMLTYDLSNYPE